MKNNATRVLAASMILLCAWSVQAQEPAPPAATTTQSDASSPQPAAPSEPAASEATKPDPASSAPASADSKPAASAVGASLTPEDRQMIRQGYQIQVRDGTKLYCKKQTTVGSRLNAKTQCVRPEDVKAMREDAQDAMREKVRNNRSEP